MFVVGISGKAGSGKDTVSDHLADHYGFRKMALADPIRRIIKDVFQVDDKQLRDRYEKEQELKNWPGWTVRKLLQRIGTEMFRNQIDERVWIKSLCLSLENSPCDLLVVSDIRLPNEREELKKKFGDSFVMIRVERKDFEGAPSGVFNHITESCVIESEYVIQNDGNLPSLYYKIDSIMDKLNLPVVS